MINLGRVHLLRIINSAVVIPWLLFNLFCQALNLIQPLKGIQQNLDMNKLFIWRFAQPTS